MPKKKTAKVHHHDQEQGYLTKDIAEEENNPKKVSSEKNPSIGVPGVHTDPEPKDDVHVNAFEESNEKFDKILEENFAHSDPLVEKPREDEAKAGIELTTKGTEQDAVTKLRQLYHNKVIEMNECRVQEAKSGIVAPHFPFERILEDVTWIGHFRNEKKEKGPKMVLKIDFLSSGAVKGIGVKSREEVASLEGYWCVSCPQDHPEAVDIIWLQTQEDSAVLVDGTLVVKEYKKDLAFDASIEGTYQEYDGNKKHGGTVGFKSHPRTTHMSDDKAVAPVETKAPNQSTAQFDLEAQTDTLVEVKGIPGATRDSIGRITLENGYVLRPPPSESRPPPKTVRHDADEDQQLADEDKELVTKRCKFIGVGVLVTIVLAICGIYPGLLITIPVAWALFCLSSGRCESGPEWTYCVATETAMLVISLIYFFMVLDSASQDS